MKKGVAFLLSMVLVVCSVFVYNESALAKGNQVEYSFVNTYETPGDTTWQNDFTYTINGNDIVLVQYKGSASDLNIPSSATISGVKLNTKLANDCSFLFKDNRNLTSVTIKNIDTSNVTNMNHMFYGCSALNSVDLSGFNTSNVTDMSYLFTYCEKLQSLDLSNFDTSNVTDMSRMFMFCKELQNINLSSFNTSNVTDMSAMFYGCYGLQNLNLKNFNTSNVNDMHGMFYTCKSLQNLDLSSFNTKKVTDMRNMFYICGALRSVNLGSFDASSATDMKAMFTSCNSLEEIKTPINVKESITPDLPYAFVRNDNPTVAYNKLPTNQTTSLTLVKKSDEEVIVYDGYTFVKNSSGVVRCYDKDGNPVINQFKCDGVYTYFFQADGTAMTDRLSYHPDGQHVIYFDSQGHEVFSNFANVKKTIANEPVNDFCFFDTFGYLYVDVLTYDKAGQNIYYANPYGVMEVNKWFQFSNNVKWADGTQANGHKNQYGYAQYDGTLLRNSWTYDWEGRWCYMQGNGVAIY